MVKKPLIASLLLFAAFTTTFTSCKKSDNKTDDPIPGTQIEQHSEDQSRVSNEMDAITNDLNVALESNTSFSGRLTGVNNICGGSMVYDTSGADRRIVITYNGPNCSQTQTRVGTVVLSMPMAVRWRNAGAQLNVTYQNLRITRTSDNKSIIINGTHTLTNVSGGVLANLATQPNITHTIRSNNMSITFSDSTQRTWQVARQRVYTYNNGIVATITGMHSANGHSGISEWGTNRFGGTFTTAINQPIVVRQDCNFRITSGQVHHMGMAASGTVTFGLDTNGVATSCPGTGTYFLKLVWTGPGGTTRTFIRPY